MITSRVEHPLPELDFSEKIPFIHFVKEVYPYLSRHPSLPVIASKLVKGLHELCEEDSDGSFATIRGGAMRTFLFHTQPIDMMIASAIDALPQDRKGKDPFTAQILTSTFGEKDIDILIKRNSFFRQSDKLTVKAIFQNLSESGFEQVTDTTFSNGTYRAELATYSIGVGTHRSFFKLNFFRDGSAKPLMRLDIGDAPTSSEEAEDIRNTPDAAKVDQLARGTLAKRNGNLELTYDRRPLDHFLMGVFFDGSKKYKGFTDISVPQLIGGLRTAGFASFFTPFLFSDPEIAFSRFFSFAIRHWNPPDDEKQNANISKWIQNHQQEIEHRRNLIISDMIYPQMINPAVWLTFSHFDGYLRYTPLGKITDNLKKIFGVLYLTTEMAGGNFMKDSFIEVCVDNAEDMNGPFNIIRALHKLGVLSEKYPVNMDTAVALADPLRYDEF